MTKYHLYYHRDLDGIASGAVLLNFLLARGDDYASCQSLDYSSDVKRHWPEFVFKEPSVLVDFAYHPDVDIWFDHHPTAFIKEEWKAHFKNSEWRQYDPSKKSCAGLIRDFLRKQYSCELPDHLLALTHEVDIFDSATFAMPDDAIGFNTAAKKIECLEDFHIPRERTNEADMFKTSLIRLIAAENSLDFLDRDEFTATYERAETLQKKAIEDLREHGKMIGKILFMDGIEFDMPGMHALPFYVFRDAWYQVVVGRKDEYYKIRMSRNNWTRPNSPINLGVLALEKDPQGGGHAGIGVMFRKTEEEARTLAHEIIEYLNKNG